MLDKLFEVETRLEDYLNELAGNNEKKLSYRFDISVNVVKSKNGKLHYDLRIYDNMNNEPARGFFAQILTEKAKKEFTRLRVEIDK